MKFEIPKTKYPSLTDPWVLKPTTYVSLEKLPEPYEPFIWTNLPEEFEIKDLGSAIIFKCKEGTKEYNTLHGNFSYVEDKSFDELLAEGKSFKEINQIMKARKTL